MQIEDLLSWLQAHPGWASVAIGVTAFVESLALVGIIVPGAFILFGIGAAVGLGIIDLTLAWIAASIGAVLGDGISFWLGHHYKSHLREIWPFTRFSSLIQQGERYFVEHGGKSVFVGRFVGPIRPIIPVIAGMMGMPVARYLPINIVASILWSPAYILPGIVFGASLDLASAVAGRLALLLAIVGAIVWLSYRLARRSYLIIAPRAINWLDAILVWSRLHPRLGKTAAALVDPDKPESLSLAALALILTAAAWVFFALLLALPGDDAPSLIDAATFTMLQSLRVPWADPFMIGLAMLSDHRVMLVVAGAAVIYLLTCGARIAAYHFAAVVLFAFLVAVVLSASIDMPIPTGASAMAAFEFPSLEVTLGTTVYGFIAVLLARELPGRRRIWPYGVFIVLSATSGFARLYLGLHWLSDVVAGIALGLIWVALVGIAYRRHSRQHVALGRFFAILLAALVGSSVWQWDRQFSSHLAELDSSLKVVEIDADRWWDQGLPKPDQSVVLGADIRTIQIQVSADLSQLRARLTDLGWEPAVHLNWKSALQSISPEPDPAALPIIRRAYLNQMPALQVRMAADADQAKILRVWPSGAKTTSGSPLWSLQLTRGHIVEHLYLFHAWQEHVDESLVQQLVNELAVEKVGRQPVRITL